MGRKGDFFCPSLISMSPAKVSDSAVKNKTKVGLGVILSVSGGGVKYPKFILKSSSLYIILKPQIG